jgi:hypothetical protein
MEKASLPHLKQRVAQVEVQASQDALEPLTGLSVVAETANANGFSLGDAFGFTGFGR